MTIREIVRAVDGKVLCGEGHLDESVDFAFASDLMSDVLTIKTDDFLLITGLANVQSVRTAEMSDVRYLLFARGKEVTDEMIELAEDNDMVVIRTSYSMFKTSGILYGAGLRPVY
ncbi:MAG TPA: hypothetical protein IAC04_07635 [Candidatus Coprenecus stercoravium]|uniref:DRTGG domain-containing protein n=1 Tax=Candidatus Coprenecus stercoravium TaxID=2840735 RepID=A0A9D2KAJ3_9BACT|nr:hypothetical protein [Candidatus Coprenecus stercoravium]